MTELQPIPPLDPPPPTESRTETQPQPQSSPSPPLHALPAPFSTISLVPLTQGAEALVYKTTFLTPDTPAALKFRPPKPYRHPVLDKRLTKQRLLAEARSLVRVKRGGVNVPGVLGVDPEAGWVVLEWVEGRTVRAVLDGWAEEKARKRGEGKDGEEGGEEDMLDLMRRVGTEVGRLHALGVCHGDLTTSNLMLRPPPPPAHTPASTAIPSGRHTVSAAREAAMSGAEPPDTPFPSSNPSSNPPPSSTSFTTTPTFSLEGDIVLIDFGLTTASIQDEDKAVDLYVLERAFAATHPEAGTLFKEVLRAYGGSYSGGKGVLRRLEGVRLRGRKRSMLG